MDSQSSPRLLRPLATSMRADGAPCVRLSPHKGMRNAAIIYEAIRNLPDTTAVRGDFDKHSHPQTYFPSYSRKLMAGSPSTRAIRARNIGADRKEFAGFLSSIVEEAYRSKNSDRAVVRACAELKAVATGDDEGRREFRVGDIREPLRVIASAYMTKNVRRQTSPHHTLARGVSVRQLKQIDRFTHMSPGTFGRLVRALSPGHNEKYDIGPDLPVTEMKLVLKAYQNSLTTRHMNFAEFLRKQGVSPYLHAFAVRWLKISIPTQSFERIMLNDQPWAAELDNLCRLIVREYRRSSRVCLSDGADAEGLGLVYRRGPDRVTSQPVSPIASAQSPAPALIASTRPISPVLPGLSPLSVSTPEDEKALGRVLSQVETLPKLDLDFDLHLDLDDPGFGPELGLGPDFGIGSDVGSPTQRSPDDSLSMASESDANYPEFADTSQDALADMLVKSLVASGVTIDSIPLPTRDSALLDLLGAESLTSESSFAERAEPDAGADRKGMPSS